MLLAIVLKRLGLVPDNIDRSLRDFIFRLILIDCYLILESADFDCTFLDANLVIIINIGGSLEAVASHGDLVSGDFVDSYVA